MRMNMKKAGLLICLMVFVSGIAIAQSCLSTNLYGKWKRLEQSNTNEESYIVFSRRSFCDSTIYHNFSKTLVHRNPYYLDKKVPDKFDKSKAGTVSYGNYLIVYLNNNELFSFKIESCSEKILKITFVDGITYTFVRQ